METITFNDVKISFPQEQGVVIEQLNTIIQPEHITAIVGASGSGKSVLGKSIVGLLNRAEVTGKILYGNTLLTPDIQQSLRGQRIFYIPQDPATALNPSLTIREQMEDTLYFHQHIQGDIALDKIKQELLAYEFEDVDCILKSYPSQLSGGMQQRVICALASVIKPQWIVADEPTKGLDAISRKSVYRLFLSMQEYLKNSMIIITHDLDFAEHISDYIIVMEKGRIVEEGLTDAIMHNPVSKYMQSLLSSMPKRMISHE